MKNNSSAIRKKKEVKQNPDKKIDEDFKGFPHGTSKTSVIKPETKEQKKIADIKNKDGEKRMYRKKESDEQDSDGSANAFDDK